MIRRKDLLKVLFVIVCVCHVCPAHPCGDNPMKVVESFSRNRGIESATMLHYMRLNTPTDYSSLMQEYRRYLDCTQMVQNGYFKRSVDTDRFRFKVPQTLTKPKSTIDSWSLLQNNDDASDYSAEDIRDASDYEEKKIVSNLLQTLLKRETESVLDRSREQRPFVSAGDWSPSFAGRKRRR